MSLHFDIKKIAANTTLVLVLSLITTVAPLDRTIANAAYNDGTCDLTSLQSQGTGSSDSPYLLSNPDQLWEITDCTTNTALVMHFKLVNDIDVSMAQPSTPTSSPIGYTGCATLPKYFRGVLDGGNFAIKNINLVSTTCGQGLFSSIREAEIRNLTLEGVISTNYGGSDSPTNYTGAISRYSDFSVTLSNVVSALTTSAKSNFGGLIGYVGGNATIVSSQNRGSFTAIGNDYRNLGGLIGKTGLLSSIQIQDSVNKVSIASARSIYVGGLIGEVTGNLAVTRSVNEGNIGTQPSGGAVGGLIGRVYSASSQISIVDSTNSGSVTGASPTGGIIGGVTSATFLLDSSRNLGAVLSNGSEAGGLAGNVSATSTISNSVNNGQVTATDHRAGGLLGWHRSGILNVVNSENFGTVTSPNQVGGAVAYSESTRELSLRRVQNYATLSATSTTADGMIGGLVGQLIPSSGELMTKVVESANLGKVTSPSTFSGGLIGNAGLRVTLEILSSFNTGLVEGKSYVGGLIGKASSTSQISDSYNVGRVSASSGVAAGLVGSLNYISSVTRAYSAGESSGNPIDGLFGEVLGQDTFSGNYTLDASTFTSQSSNQQFQQVSTFAGWDFSNVWGMPSCSVNNGYPVLRWAYPNETFYDLSCGMNSTPLVAPSTPSTPSTSVPQQYRGPLITSAQKIAYQDEIVVLDGLRLDAVSEAYVLNVQLEILNATSTSITLAISTSTALGVQDLVFISSFGRLTTMAALDIREAPTSAVNSPELLGFAWTLKFIGNSRDLSSTQIEAVNTSIGKFPAASTVICWGYTTASEPNVWAIEHANARASRVCDLIAESNLTLKTAVRIRTGMPKSAAMRVAMQFWQSRATD